MDTVDKSVARNIINAVGGPGEPPVYGFQFFTAGIDEYLDPIEQEYLSSFIKDGGGSFKMIVGTYGGGKTHFLYCVRELAWKHRFAVSYVRLTPEETPFHKLESVYQAMASNLTYPMSREKILSGYEQGIESFIREWFAQKKIELKGKGIRGYRLKEELQRYTKSIPSFESISYTNAIREAFLSLAENRRDDFPIIVQWLKGEGYDRSRHPKFGILHKIDKGTALQVIRSLVSWVRMTGYSGLVILLDEAEQAPSIGGKQKDLLLSNLRELIDECTQFSLANSMFFYAIPDEYFFQGGGRVYQALNQRLATIFSKQNPVGVKILLENLTREPEDILCEIGQKLADIFEIYYSMKFNTHVLRESIANISHAAWEERYADIGYKRLFVQSVIKGFQDLRVNPTSVVTPEIAKELIYR